MAVTFRGATNWVSGTIGVTPNIPVGTAAGDIMLMFVACKYYSAAALPAPTGWTELSFSYDDTGGTGVIDGSTFMAKTFYRLWQSGDTDPSVTCQGDVALGTIHTYSRSANSTGWATPAFLTQPENPAVTTLTSQNAPTGTRAGDMVVSFLVVPGNDATISSTSITATGATFDAITQAPVGNGTSALGTDLATSGMYASCTAGTASANVLANRTLSVAQRAIAYGTQLREIVPPSVSSGTVVDADRDIDAGFTNFTVVFNEAVQTAAAVGGAIRLQGSDDDGNVYNLAATYRSGSGTDTWQCRTANVLRNGQNTRVRYNTNTTGSTITSVSTGLEMAGDENQFAGSPLTNNLTKRARLVLRNSVGAVVANETVKYSLHAYESGAQTNVGWFSRTDKGDTTTTAAGLIDVLYTGAGVAGTDNVYVSILRPGATPTQSFVWHQVID